MRLAFQLRRPFEGPAWCRYHPAFKAMPIKRLLRHWIPSYCVAVGIQLALTLPAAAQTTAVLQGTVVDPSGAAVPSASVRIQHRANGTERGVVTDARGHFEIVALATGEYRIEVQAPGFQTQTVDPFVVDTGRTIEHGGGACPARRICTRRPVEWSSLRRSWLPTSGFDEPGAGWLFNGSEPWRRVLCIQYGGEPRGHGQFPRQRGDDQRTVQRCAVADVNLDGAGNENRQRDVQRGVWPKIRICRQHRDAVWDKRRARRCFRVLSRRCARRPQLLQSEGGPSPLSPSSIWWECRRSAAQESRIRSCDVRRTTPATGPRRQQPGTE